MKRIGRYEIMEMLGEGGMGTVYRARMSTLNKDVALKVLSEYCAKDPELVERFLREARIMANLPDYRHVVQVYDLDRWEERHFYTMEFIPLSLSEHMGDGDLGRDETRKVKRESKMLKVTEAVEIAGHVLKGLSVIHKSGVIHRDISPQNVLLEKREGGLRAKLTDFGIAGIRNSGLTRTGAGGMGKEIYVAPEQWEDLRHSDGRSDLYAVGMLLYRMVCGGLPLGFRPKEAKDLNPEVTEGLNNLILKATEMSPEGRYQSAEEMFKALERATNSSNKAPRVSVKKNACGEKPISPPPMRIPPPSIPIPYASPSIHILRSEPQQVSKDSFKNVFGLNEDCDPLEYIKNSYVDSQGGTVTDRVTGLMWQQSGSSDHMPYKKAEVYI